MNNLDQKQEFEKLEQLRLPKWSKVFAYILLAIFIFTVLLLTVTPWQQTSEGDGHVIALDPNDRVQNINSLVSGRVDKWFVQEGARVKTGDPIVEVIDTDPNFMDRLRLERDAIFAKYEAARSATETALLNLKRQEKLYNEGLSARTKFEKAKITYQKLLSSESTAAASLATAEVKLSRQETQLVRAPRDGTILRVLHGSGAILVKEGDVLATFVPDSMKQAAEVYINGNDLPLVHPGRKVRLQFEGWPAVQFSGWPSVAVGTFGGVVAMIDPTVSSNGKFRVIVVPEKDNDWPTNQYLKQGARVYSWILLNSVKLGYELWRQLNGFPAALDRSPGDVINNSKNKTKKKKKEKKYKDIYEK